MNLRKLFPIASAVIICAAGTAHAAKVTCPRYMLTAEGSSIMPFGVTYRAKIEMHKVNNAPGYAGRWKVDTFEQENAYPYDVTQPFGPLAIPSTPGFGMGQKMQCLGQTYSNIFHNLCQGGNLMLDVVGNRIGSRATGVWIGKITGNNVSIRFDANNPYDPVMVGTISTLSTASLDLKIETPQNKTDFLFTQDTPGKLVIDLNAVVSPSSSANDVTWSLPDIAGSQRTIEPATAQGPQAKLTFAGLPSQNSEFGEKVVKASVKVGSCTVEESKSVRVFFPRDAKNNPGGNAPNWFYYWRQTSACPGPSTWGDPANQCGGTPENRTDSALGYYRDKLLDSKYYICDFAKLGPEFKFETITIKNQGFDSATVTGIDTMGAACFHENGHYTHFRDWWFAHRAVHPWDPAEDFNKNSVKDTVEGTMDTDSDMVPNNIETQLGLNPNNPKTLSSLGVDLDDEEYLAWVAEAKWSIGSADKNDWAYPGKQWK